MTSKLKKDPTGAVMVVGGGIAGIQASLDLAESGYLVYLVERKGSIGGRMSQLDKTFPTNDCAMCMISPKLIGVASHPNIEIITMAEVLELTGTPGYFTARVKKHPRYIDEEKCVGCGICAEKCPSKVEDPFNEGLNKRKAAHLLYPQAVPLVYEIDRDHCNWFQKGKCRVCEKFCKNNAIDFDQKPEEMTLAVGSVILAPGMDLFEAKAAQEYGYGRYENVITTMEFERCLSATGPTDGEILRPSDKSHPQKVAWIQCVGSRESIREGRKFCSSICCMAATKEAVVAAAHHDELEPTIFFMDLRAQGKGFDAYCERAKEQSGVRYIRSMISRVAQNPVTKDLTLTFQDPETGERVEETFNMVVLSVGLKPSAEAKVLAERLDLSTNEFGFIQTQPQSPVSTSKEGVCVCGAFEGPKDIPETVAQASAAAAAAGLPIASVKGYEIKTPELPKEKSLFGQAPRVGVYVCCCGTNIAGVVDVKDCAEYAATLPNVVDSDTFLFACSTDSKEKFKELIIKNDLNRVVVASCSPKTHEVLFQDILRESGLNPYLLEMANIRNQCSWVHAKDKERATAKSRELIRMSVGRVAMLAPIEAKSVPVVPRGLVVGGGLAGMTATLALADHGYVTHLVEQSESLGGRHKSAAPLAGFDAAAHVEDLIQRIGDHPRIKVHTNSRVEKTSGHVGGFSTVVKSADGEETTVKYGAGVIATGAKALETKDYLYGESKAVMTQDELGQALAGDPGSLADKKTAVMIQCVGSRNEERPYCSRVCCTQAVNNALDLKQADPDRDVIVLYRDVRTFGMRELLYEQARKAGVVFIQFEPENAPEVTANGEQVDVAFYEPALRKKLSVTADILALSTALVPRDGAAQASGVFKVPVDKQGLLLEAHIKLRPLDFATEGMFLCGDGQAPKFAEETISQALGAAGRAVSILAKDAIKVGPCSEVDPEKCAACLTCVRTCPYQVPYINEDGVSHIDPARCVGCGMCVAECPVQAITLHHCQTEQIEAKMNSLFESA